MTLASQIRQSEDNFKLANGITQLLAEKYGFPVEEGWAVLSPTRTVDALQKYFRRERKRNDPLSNVKKPRTAFSFFTQENRAKLQAKNPNATFGELSRLVSVDWKKLSASQMKKYKDMEGADKERYQAERERVLAEAAAAAPADASTESAEETAEEAAPKSKKSRSRSSKKTTEAAPAAEEAAPAAEESAPAPSSKKSKGSKGGKGKKSRSSRTATATA
jgi:hypothetical protein